MVIGLLLLEHLYDLLGLHGPVIANVVTGLVRPHNLKAPLLLLLHLHLQYMLVLLQLLTFLGLNLLIVVGVVTLISGHVLCVLLLLALVGHELLLVAHARFFQRIQHQYFIWLA